VRALVTGAAGFIGSHLADALLAVGHEVVGVDSFSDYYSRAVKEGNIAGAAGHERFRLVEGDLTELDIAPILQGVDVVFHLAAQAGVRSSWGQSFDTYVKDNVLATQKLLEAAKGLRPERLIYASSSSVYGDAETYPTPESATPRPVSPYGVTKLAGEHLCHLYRRRFGVPALALRFFTVYGPRQRPDMAFHIFARSLLTGRPIEIFGDGEQSREFTYVGDAVRALLLAAERGRPGAVYNIGGGEEVTLDAALALLMKTSGREVPVHHSEDQPGDARRTAADPALARRDLGYEPRIGLEEGLRSEYAWLEALLTQPAGRLKP
jgi:nucleoside-diphosphate-sugar epimerase